LLKHVRSNKTIMAHPVYINQRLPDTQFIYLYQFKPNFGK